MWGSLKKLCEDKNEDYVTLLFYTDESSQETTKLFTAQTRIRKVSLFL